MWPSTAIYFFREFKELKMFSITGHKDLKGFAVPGWQHTTYVSQELIILTRFVFYYEHEILMMCLI